MCLHFCFLFSGQFQEDKSFHQHFGFEFLWFRIQKHYEKHFERLHVELGITDPISHIRNQLKESIGRFVEAFVGDKSLLESINRNVRTSVELENAFGFYGCDFIIDADLDVWFIEAQTSPAMGSYYQYRIDTWCVGVKYESFLPLCLLQTNRSLLHFPPFSFCRHRVLPPMFAMVDEIQQKQQRDPNANVLPLKTRGGWELVYAGGQGYRYKGYRRTTTKKSCTPKSPPRNVNSESGGNDDKGDDIDLFAQDRGRSRNARNSNHHRRSHNRRRGK